MFTLQGTGTTLFIHAMCVNIKLQVLQKPRNATLNVIPPVIINRFFHAMLQARILICSESRLCLVQLLDGHAFEGISTPR